MAVEREVELDLFKNPEKYLNMIQDEDKIIRRNGMKLIWSQVQEGLAGDTGSGTKGAGDPGPVKLHFPDEIITTFLRPVVVLIQDPVEKTREVAYELLGIFIRKLLREKLVEVLPLLIPIMTARLGQPEINEPSEEVRLIAVSRIKDLLKALGNQMNPFIDDILQILANGIMDSYHEVRILSCDVACLASDVCRTVFHYNSDRLIRPLALSVTHQHSRVRLHTVKCIHQVVLLGNHKGIEKILPYLTQRVFDPVTSVRLALLEAVGQWLVDFIDRYSYFSKLIPVVVGLLDDEEPKVQGKAREVWERAGNQYLEENVDKYRDEVDFPIPQQQHYPLDVQRPTLGCRILIWHQASHFLPALPKELEDWLPATRDKAGQLLYYVILHSEMKIVMHVEKVFTIIFRSIADSSAGVVNHCMRAANLIGYFVPLDCTWTILTSTINQGPTAGNLSTLAQVLIGTEPGVLATYAEQITEFLVQEDILESLSPKRQRAILASIGHLVRTVPSEVTNGNSAHSLFRILITIWAQFQIQDPEIALQSQEIMKLFAGAVGVTLDELIGKFSGKILESMKNSSEWTPVSLDRLIFHVILSQGGIAVDRNMNTILEIMSTNLDPNKDPEVRLKFFNALAQHLVAYSRTTKIQKEKLQNFIVHIIQDVLDPNVTWHPGQSASVLRAAALSCMVAIVDGDILDPSIIVTLTPKMVVTVSSTSEDSSEVTRFLTCAFMEKLMTHAGKGISPFDLKSMYPVMLKRLDDVSKRVRMQALDAVYAIFKYLYHEYGSGSYEAQIEYVFERLVLHMDDEDEEIQDKVQAILEEIGELRPTLLVAECEKSKMKHRTQERCQKLINIFKDMSISSIGNENILSGIENEVKNQVKQES